MLISGSNKSRNKSVLSHSNIICAIIFHEIESRNFIRVLCDSSTIQMQRSKINQVIKQNTVTTMNSNSNNNKNYNNNNNNTSNSKENNNKLITIALPNTDAKCNYAAIKEEKSSFPKKVLLRQNTNIEKYLQKNQIRSPKLKDGKSTRELESDHSSCVTCFAQNPSMIFSRTDYIDFYEKYLFKDETLRKFLENGHITLHSKRI